MLLLEQCFLHARNQQGHRLGVRHRWGGVRGPTLSRLMIRRAAGPLAPLLDAMIPAHVGKVAFRRESMPTGLASS